MWGTSLPWGGEGVWANSFLSFSNLFISVPFFSFLFGHVNHSLENIASNLPRTSFLGTTSFLCVFPYVYSFGRGCPGEVWRWIFHLRSRYFIAFASRFRRGQGGRLLVGGGHAAS